MNENQFSYTQAQAVNAQLMGITARGITLLFSSGDYGVWGLNNNGTMGEFYPGFPATSPYVTVVGGTEFAQNTTGNETCSQWGGGGFSNLFDVPDYQSEAVLNYLNTTSGLPLNNLWNRSGFVGRAYPDVSGIYGSYIPYCIVAAGYYVLVDGTSASTPVVAAMIALLNDIRFSNNMTSVGWVNPWLYSLSMYSDPAINDITSGSNGANYGSGFPAAPGWDPCSGVGSINFAVLQTYALE